jgi:glycosyltransferase involved in cell wall biosynthesis
VPALYTPHGTSWHYTGATAGRVQLAFERALRRVTSALVSVCPEEAGAFVAEVGFDPARVRLVRNGIRLPDLGALARRRAALRARLGMGRDELWLVFVGRLTREKGLDVLIDALARGVGVHGLLVVGDGPLRPALEAQAVAARIRVSFCGYRPDVSPWLAAADVAVQPSRSEGMPFAALEAMAHGLPVVGSRVGGLAGVLGDDVAVPAEDPAALAAALRRLVRDPARRGALATAARARAEDEFDVSAMPPAIHAAYAEAVDGTPRRARLAWARP